MTSTLEDESPGTQTLVVVTPAEVEVVLVAEADKLIWFAASVTEELEVEDAAPAAAVSVEAEAAAAVGPDDEVAAGPLCNK